MSDIWAFLLQSLSVSIVAGFLLIVKRIFKDKLTPRWQYGIWIILILRIIIPVRADRFVLLPFGLYIEIARGFIENRLNSSFSSALTATQLTDIIPRISSAPTSITDLLFVIYIIGILVFLSYYLISYIRLRLILKKGNRISLDKDGELQRFLCENGVKNIRTVTVNGITGAFICGIISPVLVLPYGRETDKKVLLHEIMHLKSRDSLQNILWCILRCLHWCNPFMHYVFNIIGNDMEMLCDQRVLEKLEGEDRRAYGILLLNEVNKKYARMPGTTSVSNGGKNISRRIEAIVRFKKYPRGMALVSVCIAIILSLPCLFVSAGASVDNSVYFPATEYEFLKATAYSRINRCPTVAGAIDTYAKALIESNGIMLLTASPTEKHVEILGSLHEYHKTEDSIDIHTPEGGRPYTVLNLNKADADRYTAVLVFSTDEENRESYSEKTEYAFGDTLLVPVEIFKENSSWVIREAGERKKSANPLGSMIYNYIGYLGEDAPVIYESVLEGENGTLTVRCSTAYQTDYGVISSENPSFFTDGLGYDTDVHTDAGFSGCLIESGYVYNYAGEDYKDVTHVAMEYTSDPETDFPSEKTYLIKNYGSSSTDGIGKRAYNVNEFEEWNRTVSDEDADSNQDADTLAEGYKASRRIGIYIDGRLADTFTVEVDFNGQ